MQTYTMSPVRGFWNPPVGRPMRPEEALVCVPLGYGLYEVAGVPGIMAHAFVSVGHLARELVTIFVANYDPANNEFWDDAEDDLLAGMALATASGRPASLHVGREHYEAVHYVPWHASITAANLLLSCAETVPPNCTDPYTMVPPLSEIKEDVSCIFKKAGVQSGRLVQRLVRAHVTLASACCILHAAYHWQRPVPVRRSILSYLYAGLWRRHSGAARSETKVVFMENDLGSAGCAVLWGFRPLDAERYELRCLPVTLIGDMAEWVGAEEDDLRRMLGRP